MDIVYHSSPFQGLGFIKPRLSKHGVRYVYAALDPAFSLVFLHNKPEHFGSCMINWGRMNGSRDIYIHERISGAFAAAYEGAKGSMYHLPKSWFSSLPNDWPEEVVSRRAVCPVNEVPIDNVAAEIMTLSSCAPVHLYFYPDRPPFVPADDSDLVFSTLSAASLYGYQFLRPLEALHPRLFQTAEEILNHPYKIHRLENGLGNMYSPQEICALERRLETSGRTILQSHRAAVG